MNLPNSQLNMKLRKIFFLLFFLCFVFLNTNPFFARAEEIGLAVTKNTFDLEIIAGDSYKDNLTVLNQSAKVALPVNIEFSPWDLKKDSDDIEFVMAEPALNAAKWFKTDPENFILDPDGAREINFTIEIPSRVPSGTYLAMMRFKAVLPEHYFEAQGPRFIPELGVLFFIKVSALSLDGVKNPYQAEIISIDPKNAKHIGIMEKIISTAKAGVFEDTIKILSAKIKNTGFYHFKASGFLEIKNIFGRTVYKTELENRYLLPDRSRNLEIKVFPPPLEKTDSSIKNLWNSVFYSLKENSYLGPYNAVLTLNIPGEPPAVFQTNFWIIPWKFWLPAIMIILGVFYIFIRFRGRINNFFRVLIKGNIRQE